ncbi:hypothetical protein BHE74_00005749, partial [Ensete ventricosum]
RRYTLLASYRLLTHAAKQQLTGRETADALNYSLSARRYTLSVVIRQARLAACRRRATLLLGGVRQWRAAKVSLVDSDSIPSFGVL